MVEVTLFGQEFEFDDDHYRKHLQRLQYKLNACGISLKSKKHDVWNLQINFHADRSIRIISWELWVDKEEDAELWAVRGYHKPGSEVAQTVIKALSVNYE